MNAPVAQNFSNATFHQQLKTMLDLQNRMNEKVNPSWLSAGYAWMRAAMMEAAESVEHHGWKWWKKQQMNLPQLQMELVDIWHFALSYYLARYAGSQSVAALEILEDANEGVVQFDGAEYCLQEIDLLEKLDLMVGLSAAKRFELALFLAILKDCQMSTDELYRQYVGKNVLNFFRQDHGYKDGTYIKEWQGREDNEHLVEIMSGLDVASSQFADDVYAGLKGRYPA